MPMGFLTALVSLGLGLIIGAAAGAAGVVWGQEMARTYRIRESVREAMRGRGK